MKQELKCHGKLVALPKGRDISAASVVKQLGVSRETLRKWRRYGFPESRRCGRKYMLDVEAVAHFLTNHGALVTRF